MRSRSWRAVALVAVLSGCTPGVGPTPLPGTAAVGTAPTSATPELFLPFPEGVVIEPGPDAPSATITASSDSGAEVGVVYRFELGHCGFGSPFDFDGSLWDPVGAVDRALGPVDSSEEIGELINAVPGELVLTDADHAQFRTPLETVVALERRDGPKEYSLCD